MSVFGTILHKIFSAAGAVLGGGEQPSGIAAATVPSGGADADGAGIVPAAATVDAPAPSQPVDVEAVLSKMAEGKGGGGNWRTSIVDLLKLLDLDSSLEARKQLAGELDVHVGADGTAAENVALHRAVMQKISENGGTVPDSLKQA